MSTRCRLRTERRVIISILIAIGGLGAADRFEVAAIHPSDPNSRGAVMKFPPGGGLSISDMSIRNLIWLAWQLPPERVIGGPKWIDSDMYTIEARTAVPSASTLVAERPRIQTLLHERFRLKEHWESKVSAGYDLSVAAGGLKLKKDGDPSGKGSILPWGIFILDLSRRLGRPVIDRTKLTGAWYVQLHYTDEDGNPNGIGDRAPGGPSIFTAVEEQLGLKLNATKAAIDVLVIDSISRPTPN